MPKSHKKVTKDPVPVERFVKFICPLGPGVCVKLAVIGQLVEVPTLEMFTQIMVLSQQPVPLVTVKVARKLPLEV